MAELVAAVAPRVREKARPWSQIADAAVAHYETIRAERRRADPFLRDHKDGFISVSGILSHKADIRDALLDTNEILVPARGRHGGVFITTGKNLITEAFLGDQRVIMGSSERYNRRVERINKKRKMQMKTMAVQLLLPPPVE